MQLHKASSDLRLQTLACLDDADFDHRALARAAKKVGGVEQIIDFYDPSAALDFLSHANSAMIDFFFVDLQLPQMSGIEFIETADQNFGHRFAHKVFLTLTLEPDRDTLNRMRAIDCISGWIAKPISPKALRDLSSGRNHAPSCI